MNVLTIGSLFSGIGGLELGLEWAGLGPVVWQVEHDLACRRILGLRWPGADRSVKDVRLATAANLAPVDLICGGFPCQDVSSAGKGVGLAGSRSGLWHEFHRVIWHLRPRWVVVENVASGAVRWVDDVVAGLEQLDYQAVPFPLSAADVGAWHLRRRVFVVAHAHQERQHARAVDAEVASASEVAAHAQRNEIRHESRRGGGQDGASEAEPGHDGWWRTEPDVERVVHGLSGSVDRRRMLGNSVVPQCAEVVGWIVRELANRAG